MALASPAEIVLPPTLEVDRDEVHRATVGPKRRARLAVMFWCLIVATAFGMAYARRSGHATQARCRDAVTRANHATHSTHANLD